MDNILELHDLIDFDFSKINLGNPTLIHGNNYYTKINIGTYDKNLYIQLPKCKTKQGIVNTNNKCYCDLVYNASDSNIIKWFENLENYFQNQIFKKRDLWFQTDINIDDLQELMTPIMRTYKSGKNILIRTFIKNNKCSLYDENEKLLSLENLNNENEIIPLILINGIKFSSKNFVTDILLPQLMIITPQEELEKSCLIKSKNNKEIPTLATKKNNSLAIPENNTLKNTENNENNDSNDNLASAENNESNESNNTLENAENNGSNNSNDTLENAENNENMENNDNNNSSDTLASTENNETNESNESNNILESMEDIESSKNKTNYLEDSTICSNNNSKNEFRELDLNLLNTLNEYGSSSKTNEISLKTPNDIYYELYKTAIKKAKDIRKNAIEAFLQAKNIKTKYSLEDLDISDTDTEDYTNEEYNQ